MEKRKDAEERGTRHRREKGGVRTQRKGRESGGVMEYLLRRQKIVRGRHNRVGFDCYSRKRRGKEKQLKDRGPKAVKKLSNPLTLEGKTDTHRTKVGLWTW